MRVWGPRKQKTNLLSNIDPLSLSHIPFMIRYVKIAQIPTNFFLLVINQFLIKKKEYENENENENNENIVGILVYPSCSTRH